MAKTPAWRWVVLGLLLAATTVASVFPIDDQVVEVAPTIATPIRQPGAGSHAASQLTEPKGALSDLSTIADPFEPRGWKPAPPPAPVPIAVQKVAEMHGPPQPPVAPPLPFSYLGRYSDESGQVVYVGHGERMYVIRRAEPIADLPYKVSKVDANAVEFLHVPTGTTQAMNIPSAENSK